MSKKKAFFTTVLAVVVVGAAAGGYYAWQPEIEPLPDVPRPSADSDLLRQGARLAELGDCMQCHTAKGGAPYAGGLAIDTPFGAIYSTNITPDADTGIGRWSQDAFARAMRQGVSRDGHLLYPAFPYAHFTHMADDDIAALYAYLMARTPVQAPPHSNALTFPLNFRPLVAGWNLLFLDEGELSPAQAKQSSAWLRGRYLVEGPGHCAACHTPLNALGAEQRDQAYAGGLIDGWDVPALNALAAGPNGWTHEQLSTYLRTGLASERGAASGPMGPVTHHLSHVPKEDTDAMATYLLSLHNETATAAHEQAAPSLLSADDPQMLRGKSLFNASCASCHGDAAAMRVTGAVPSLTHSTTVNADGPRNAIRLVLDGNPWQGSNAAHYMPPFRDVLNDEQIADVLTYVRTAYAHKAGWNDLSANVAAIRKETTAP